MANNRIQFKRTNISGRLPNTTNSSNGQYIAAGEFALNMADKVLYTSDGNTLITVGSTLPIGTFNDSIVIGNVANNIITINSTAFFAGNTDVSMTINATALAVQNTTSNTSVTPTTIFVGNTSANVTVDMQGGVSQIPIVSANIDSTAVVTIRTSVDHGITLLTQSKVLVNTSNPSLNTANYSTDYSAFGFDIRSVPTPNTISFVLPNDSFKQTAPGNRTIASISRDNTGKVTVVTNGPHFYSNGDLVYASAVGYTLADFYVSGGSAATVVDNVTVTYQQSQYATTTKSLVGALAAIYIPPFQYAATSGPYYFYIEAADPVFNGFNPEDPITFINLPVTIQRGFQNNFYSPSYFNGNHVIYTVQVNDVGYKTVLVQAGIITEGDIFGRYLYPVTNPYVLSQGDVLFSYVEEGRVNNNSQLCPVLATTSIGGTITATKPTGISIKNGSKLVYVLDNVIFVGNNTIGNIVDSKGSRAFRPTVLDAVPYPTYSITSSKYYYNEGDEVTFNITTTNFGTGLLYWTNAGTLTAADFTQNINYGVINMTNDVGVLTLNIKNDVLLEGNETIIIQIRTGSTAGPVVTASYTVMVGDTSFPPTYKITPDRLTMNEGQTVTFNVETTGVVSGSALFWKNVGSTTGLDFTDGYNSGAVIINSGFGSFTRTITNDFLTEGYETIDMRLLVGSVTGTVVATAQSVTVTDTSVSSYSVIPTASTINEGSTVRFNITTVGIPDETILYWTNDGTITTADLTSAITSTGGLVDNTKVSGYVKITSGTAYVQFTVANDSKLEGSESIQFNLRSGSIAGPLLTSTPASVTVTDTSVPTYAVTATTTAGVAIPQSTINEGQTVRFNIYTTGVDDGSILYWSSIGTTTAIDFTDNVSSGYFTINSGYAYVDRTLSEDFRLELPGQETIRFYIRQGSVTGSPLIYNPTIVYVTDSSYPTYSIAASASSVNEGDTITFNITTTGIPDGTVLYWSNDGSTKAVDFTDNTNSAPVTIISGSAVVKRTLLADALTENTETVIFNLRQDSTTGNILATSPVSIQIIDTSTTPAMTITAKVNNTVVTSVNEGITITYTITTNNIPSGSVYYWTNDGTTDAADFDGLSNQGTVTITNNTGTIIRTLRADSYTESSETIKLRIRADSYTGIIVANAPDITVNDTSTGTMVISSTVDNVIQSSANEGKQIVFNISTVGIPNGTVYNWYNVGTTTAGDFVENINSGSVTIYGTASISLTLKSDKITEGAETIKLRFYSASDPATLVASAPDVTINDTSVIPTYTLTTTSVSYDEGVTATYTLQTTDVDQGTQIYLSARGTSGTLDYTFQQNPVTVDSNRTATINVNLLSDGTAEGPETFILQSRLGSTTGTVVAEAQQITINDTSFGTFTITSLVQNTSDNYNVQEGWAQGVLLTIYASKMPTNTTLYWVNEGTSTGDDFTDGKNNGTLTFSAYGSSGGGSAQIQLYPATDTILEGPETIVFKVKPSLTSTTVYASTTVNITDTTISPYTFKYPAKTGSIISATNSWLTIGINSLSSSTVSGISIGSKFYARLLMYNSNIAQYEIVASNILVAEKASTLQMYYYDTNLYNSSLSRSQPRPALAYLELTQSGSSTVLARSLPVTFN